MRLQPARDAMEVESVIADTPRGVAFFRGRGDLVGLAVDAQIHDVVPADGAVVYDDVPSPERDSIPLLNLESLLSFFLLALFLHHRLIDVHVSHCEFESCVRGVLKMKGERKKESSDSRLRSGMLSLSGLGTSS